MTKITAKTKLCAVIGDPIEHSMSPLIQNAAFSDAKLDYTYVAFRVKGSQLEQAIAGMRAFNIAGLNVTIPHKVSVMQYLDKLDPLAEKIGAVNTIVNQDGVLTGHNTDAGGFMQALLETGFKPKGKNVVILGAGGAARGISFILAEHNAHLVIFNRTRDKALELQANVKRHFKTNVEIPPFDQENLRKLLDAADLLVNTTSVGMHPNTADTPLDVRLLRPDLPVYDIVYNPVETALIKAARAIGAQTISGVDMLVWQGALAFEKWTGHKAPVETMRNELVKALQH